MLEAVIICLMLVSGQGLLLEELSDQNVQCSWGAQYWCSSLTTADACGKTEWCTKNHWSYNVIQDVPCSVMQQLVTNVRTLAKVSSLNFLTYNEIAVYIAKGCALLHDGESKNQCKQLITDEDILLKLLRLTGSDLSAQSVAIAVGVCRRNLPSEQDSGVVCEGLQSCGLSKQNVINSGTDEQVDGAGPTCYICQLVVQKLESLLAKNATEKQIEAALLKFCNFLPHFTRKACSAFVTNYTQKLVELLLRYPPSLVCSVIQFCSGTAVGSVSEIQQSASMNGTTKCSLCQLIINQVKSMLSQHTTQDEIKAALKKVCHQLPPILQSVCNNVVETYEPQLIQMMLSSFTAEQICQKLKMCKDVQVYVSEVQQPSSVNDAKCFLCKLVINQVKSKLSQHTTQDEIKAALEKVCHQLPPSFQSACNSVVESYEPQLIQWLLSSFTAEQICERLNMCTDVQVSDESKFLKFVSEKTTLSTTPAIKEHCNTCLLALYNFQSTLNNPNWQNESRAVLLELCSYLQNDQGLCKLLVDASFSNMVTYIQDFRFPVDICQKTGICEP